MKNYSVKEIADMLNTNPETVRRWVRSGRLEAEQMSKKEGNVISENALSDFLRKTPKYATIAKASMATGLAVEGLSIFVGLSLLTTKSLLSKFLAEKQSLEEMRISPQSISKYVHETIKDIEISVKEKKEKIHSIENEIHNDEKQIVELKALLERLSNEQLAKK